MFKTLLLSALVLAGMIGTAGNAQAHYPYYGAYYRGPYYGNRYYGGPRWAGYGPYYNYGYRYYAPAVYPAYPVYGYPAPAYYYGPRLGVSYVSPRVGVFVGY